jgi:PAS domain S-box-containing protein
MSSVFHLASQVSIVHIESKLSLMVRLREDQPKRKLAMQENEQVFNFEENLHDSEILKLLLSMLNSAHNGIIALDNAARIVFMNKAAEELIGIDLSRAKGALASSVTPESDLQRVIETGQAETGRKISINGRVVISNRSAIRANGIIIGAVGIFQDISDLEAVARELESVKLLNREFGSIIDSVYDGLIVYDEKGTILRVNSAYEEIAGIKASYLLGKNVRQLIEEGFVSESLTLRVIETKMRDSQSIRINTGKELFHSAVPVFNDAGELTRIVTIIRDLTELNNLRRKLEVAEAEKVLYRNELKRIKDKDGRKHLVIYSPKMKEIFELATRLALFDTTVLISGESGVGKEVVARYIHENSLRKDNPFIRVNCGAIPEHLLESELFGYEKGAFTGANKEGKRGLLEAATGGSFLFDEISELPLVLQVKLLRVLQEQEFFRVGGNKSVTVNIRFMAASNIDLFSLVEKNLFRNDLFYRLNVARIVVPPLRERKEEIPGLVMLFLRKFNDKYNQNKQINNPALEMLCHYHWPGNIRELENTIERLAIMCQDDVITHQFLQKSTSDRLKPDFVTSAQISPDLAANLKDTLDTLEKKMISNAYKQTGCTRKAGLLLGINQSTVVKKMKKHGLTCNQLISTNS